MPIHSVEFKLGRADLLFDIFSFSPALAADKSPSVLRDSIEHAINQTLSRDLCYSAWAVVSSKSQWKWVDDDVYSVRITSPNKEVECYKQIYPKFLKAVAKGRKIYDQQIPALNKRRKQLVAEWNKEHPKYPKTVADVPSYFLPPFGLSMANSNAVQLLHYPPAETLTYMDYLYSPTNRRWENLLGYNGYPGAKNTLVETIVDIGPIAAAGGSIGGQLIEPVLDNFHAYAVTMLKALLRHSKSGKTTTPIVAYGSPVGKWLWKHFKRQISAQKVRMIVEDGKPVAPEIGEVFSIKFLGPKGPSTPVLCANHPIKFNYYDSDYKKAEKETKKVEAIEDIDRKSAIVLSQDLIAAGWHAAMSENWQKDPDPMKIRNELFAKWGNHKGAEFKKLFQIFREQVIEFSLSSIPAVNTEAWLEQLEEAMGQ